MRHILLVVNSFVTARDPRRGAKFRLHVKAYLEKGWKVGIAAIRQRDYHLSACIKRLGIVAGLDQGAPIVRDCTLYSVLGRVPAGRRIYRWSDRLPTRAIRYYIARHGKPDLLHAHGSEGPGEVAHRVQQETGLPYVLTEHMTNYAQGRVRPERYAYLGQVFAGAKINLPISDPLGVLLERSFGDAFRPWQAVPNMVDIDLFAGKVTGSKNALPFTFVSMSQLVPKKGFDVLLRAFHRAFGGTDVRLRIGGDGPDRSRLEMLARELGIKRQVDFLGYITRVQVADELSRASAYVLPSYYETFGIPVIEAQAIGLPVVTTRCGGPESFIEEGTNGLVVPPGDVEAFSCAMRRVRETVQDYDPVLISESCRSRFSPCAVTATLDCVYEDALGV